MPPSLDNQPTDHLATRIREVRLQRGITQDKLAFYSTVSLSTIHRLDAATEYDDIKKVPIDQFVKIADALGCTAATLLPRLNRRDAES